MKTEEQIKIEVTTAVVNDNRTKINEQISQIETEMEDLYKTKIDQDVQDTLEIAETGCTTKSPKVKEQDNKKFQQQLSDVRFQKEALEKKLKALDDFH